MSTSDTKIITISLSESEAGAWSREAKKMKVSRSKYIRDSVEKSRDLKRILANQKIKGRTPRERARAAGDALIDIYEHNHENDLD